MNNIDFDSLTPKEYQLSNGNTVYGFQSDSVELVKMDFCFEAGAAYQKKLMCAAATTMLIGEGTARHTALEVAEYMDYRGIVIERNPDITTPAITFYTLKKFVPELMPWIKEILSESVFPQEEFDVYVHKRKRQLMAQMQKTSHVAMTSSYEALFGPDHMMGRYAVPEDFDKLTLEDVKSHYKDLYNLGNAQLIISGNYDEETLKLYDQYFGQEPHESHQQIIDLGIDKVLPAKELNIPLKGAVQSTIRIGRILPLKWNSEEYAQFMILTTILGGYMGSRLMSSVREEKGYTYGISAFSTIGRGHITFFITTDVGGQYTKPATEEIFRQIALLQQEPVSEEELQLVRSVMEGDFLRSIDGIFERSERYRQMSCNGVSEKFRENYFHALEHTTPAQLRQLAKRLLDRNLLTTTIVGVTNE